jgi:glutamyl-tRNA synthetase
MVRVRFAPSPTGYLHVGGARTALFNWLFARKHGGQFLLRIEDTDKARSTDESTRAIFEGLTWLGLTWDEDVVYQGANLERHRRDAHALLASGAAYRCFCTATELDARRADADGRQEAFRYDRRCDRLDAAEVDRRVAAAMPYTIRFRVPEGSTGWTDLVHGDISFPNKDIDDLVILRSDGTPIYNMAVVSDDIAMRISHVLRGEDHISNTPKQILLYRALGVALPQFAHFPNVLGTDGKKLSKRHGATAVGDYAHMGILPEAMCNFLALLGWSPGGDREVMTAEEMIGYFSEDGLLAKASVFDVKKLEWMNGQHLIRLTEDEIAQRIDPTLKQLGIFWGHHDAETDTRVRGAIRMLRPRSRTLNELSDKLDTYLQFGDKVRNAFTELAKAMSAADKIKTSRLLDTTVSLTVGASYSDAAEFEAKWRGAAAAINEPPKALFQAARAALTGSNVSPPLFDVMKVLGEADAVNRQREFKRQLDNPE